MSEENRQRLPEELAAANTELKALYRSQLTKKLIELYDAWRGDTEPAARMAFVEGYLQGMKRTAYPKDEYLRQLE